MPPALLRLAPLLFVLLWSTGFIGTKGAALNAEPFSFLTVRFVLAAALMALLTAARRGEWPTRQQAAHAAVTGLLLHAGYLGAVTYGLWAGLPTGVMAVVTGLQPLLTALLSWPLLGETVSGRQWSGLGLGFGGVLLVVLGREAGAPALTPAALLCAGLALLFTTAGTLYQRRFGARMPLLGGTTVQYAVSALVTGALMLLRGQPRIEVNAQFVGSLAWLVLALSVGAVLLLMYLIRERPAAQVGSLFYLVPPLVVVEAYLLFGERLSLASLLGLALCVGGVALASLPARSPTRDSATSAGRDKGDRPAS